MSSKHQLKKKEDNNGHFWRLISGEPKALTEKQTNNNNETTHKYQGLTGEGVGQHTKQYKPIYTSTPLVTGLLCKHSSHSQQQIHKQHT